MEDQTAQIPSTALVLHDPWYAIRTGLGLLPSSSSEAGAGPADGEQTLKTEILRLWPEYQRYEKSKHVLGQRLYELRALLHSPGKKGAGFDAWLKEGGIPRSTAYWLIKRHCKREGLATPNIPKKTTAKKAGSAPTTLSNVGQASDIEGQAEYVPAPTSVLQLIGLLARFCDNVTDLTTRNRWANEIHAWLDSSVLGQGAEHDDNA